MSWKSLENAIENGPISLIWWVFVRGLFLSIIIGGISSCTMFVFNPLTQWRRIVNKTIDADNVIYNYEWFKRQYQDVKATEAKIVSSQVAVNQFKEDAGPRESWHREDREENSRLSSVLLGLKQQRNDMAAEYNAKSQMANRSIFKSGDLPNSIPIEE